jgi:predicted dehydrogenase
MKTNNIVIIGFGKQGKEYFECISKIPNLNILAIVDDSFKDKENVDKYKNQYELNNIKIIDSINNLDEYSNCTAMICIPHKFHFETTYNCLQKGFNVIKEKPLDFCYSNALKIKEIAIKNNRKVFTLCQRVYDPIFIEFIKKMGIIGKPYAIQYDYFLSHNKTTGWRAKKEIACGGVLLDMGYHIIDTINNYFGNILETNSYNTFSNEDTKKEILEDYTTISFKNSKNIIGTINIGRNYFKKKEYLTIFCNSGVAEISPKKGFSIHDNNGEEIYKVEINVKNEQVVKNQIEDFINIINFNDDYSYKRHLDRHILNVKTIEEIYSKQEIFF